MILRARWVILRACWVMLRARWVTTEIAGFSSDEQTLFCCNAVHNQMIQVTSKMLRLVSASTLQLLHQWTPPPGYQINVATASSTQVPLLTLKKHPGRRRPEG